MDLSLVPKLVAAAVLGGAAVAAPPGPAEPVGTVSLKLEWVGAGKTKTVESVFLRATNEETTTLRQGGRTVEATPMPSPDGTFTVKLKIVDTVKPGGESLDTTVRTASGETVTVMGATKKEGKETQERLLFLTAGPVDR